MNSRIKRVIDNMKKHNLSQMIVTSPSSVFYLSGALIDPGERLMAMYINVSGKVTFIINSLFKNSKGLGNNEIVTYDDSEEPIPILLKIINKESTLGIDKNWPAHFLIELMENSNMKFINSSPIIDEVRMIKDEEEIKVLRESSKINDKVMEELIKYIDESKTEKEMAKVIQEIFQKNGIEKLSFETICSYGKNGADPHHMPDDTKLKEGDSIVIDMGGVYNNYCSDMTRTFFYKEPCEEAKKIYDIVKRANEAGKNAVKPGVKLSDIDKITREVIEKEGYGEYFTHRTGHNIGIEDHEFPSVGGNSDIKAQVGMVFSIEPGIYIPEKYGVRIEDLVVVTETGCEVLNHVSRDMNIL
ncbi:Xaa-Pro peptidase family protein [Clostridium felsineum]|uniref:M24 family metallopeptidase n=1 Tax=Clostridium felsineum TaxID=36839 RepID=UPI00214D6C38|nr:Xaa-Pro peptidase family protein [Clostridium felsineum]MCR3760766.1 Xaa-Pro peptidase family protein [Clostridium felsineum]